MSLVTLKISLTERERNFCEDDTHRPGANHDDLILNTRENELDSQKPIDEAKLEALLANGAATGLRLLELGEIKFTPKVVELIANCGSTCLACVRLYDCIGLDDAALKLFGQRFGKSIRDLELVGNMEGATEDGVRSLIMSIGNLEALHLDSAISLLATNSGTITNMRHVWAKLTGDELDKWSAFTIKYAPYLRHLDLTLMNTKEKTPEFVKLIGNLTGLTKLSLTSTSSAVFEPELAEVLAKLAASLTSLNLCLWGGGDATIEAIARCSNLENLALNGRSPVRHIDFRLTKPIAPTLAAGCGKLKNLRLILKNHSPSLLTDFASKLANLETLELEGLDIDDAALGQLGGLKKLGLLDIVSPAMTENGLATLIPQLPSITFLRVNEFGSDKLMVKALDAIASEAKKRLDTPIEAVFTGQAKIDLDSRRTSLPPNLTVSKRNSTHLLSFPGCHPRGF